MNKSNRYKIGLLLLTILSFSVIMVTLWLDSGFLTPSEHIAISSQQIIPLGADNKQSFAYAVNLSAPLGWLTVVGDTNKNPMRSKAILLEDGVPFGTPHVDHVSIGSKGKGGYSQWYHALYFSTNDNSDPRNNGHKYEVIVRYSLSNTMFTIVSILFVMSNLLLMRSLGIKFYKLRYYQLQHIELSYDERRLKSSAVFLSLVLGLISVYAVLFWFPSISTKIIPSNLTVLSGSFNSLIIFILLIFTVFNIEKFAPNNIFYGKTWSVFYIVLCIIGIVLFTVPLLELWRTGKSTYTNIGGLLPWGDSAGYYWGSMRIMEAGVLDAWNGRRPLNAVLYALRMFLTDGNLQYVLALNAVFVSLVGLMLAREITRIWGLSIGVLLYILLYLSHATMADNFIPTLLSENNGVLLGVMAFISLSRAALRRSIFFFGFGMFLLSLGLSARAGAFFILPALLIWSRVFLKIDDHLSWKPLIWGVIGIAIGQILPLCFVILLHGFHKNVVYSNFSYVLYSMALGGKGWQQIYSDHPELFAAGGVCAIESKACTMQIYSLVLHAIMDHPKLFCSFYFTELFRYWEFIIQHLGGAFSTLYQLGLIYSLMRWRIPFFALLLCSFIGIALSAPFLMNDGGPRVFTTTIVFELIFVAIGLWFSALLCRHLISLTKFYFMQIKRELLI